MILENRNEALNVILEDLKELQRDEMTIYEKYKKITEWETKYIKFKHSNPKFAVLELSCYLEFSAKHNYLSLEIFVSSTYEYEMGVFVAHPRTKEEDEFYEVQMRIDSQFKIDKEISNVEHFKRCIKEVSNGLEALIG